MTKTEKLIEDMRNAREKSELEILRGKIDYEINIIKKEKEDLKKIQKETLWIQHNISKNIEFYSQSYSALYNTALEQDKSILTLSLAGLGFLISNIPQQTILYERILYFIATTLFIVSAVTILLIFDGNKKYIREIVSDNEESEESENTKLKKLDNIARYSFFSALILTTLIGFFKIWDVKGIKENDSPQSYTIDLNISKSDIKKEENNLTQSHLINLTMIKNNDVKKND